jgi:cell division protease FtsH
MKNKKKQTFKSGFKGFKFQIYWIYIIIFIFFIGLNFMGTEMSKPTNWQEFNSQMLQPQKVDKIVVVNKEKAYIYIDKDFLSEEKFKEISKKRFGDAPNFGPHYYFEIGSVETFANDLKEAQSSFENDEKLSPFYETRSDVFGDIIGWILPLAFFCSNMDIYNEKNEWRKRWR